MPAISVIVPVFNRERYIAAALRSLLRQSFSDFEVLVIDDGSTDGSVDAALALGDPRVRVVPHSHNQGIPAARNTGLREARGAFIAWLDSDDIAHPHRLEAQIDYLRRNPATAMIGSCAAKIDAQGRALNGLRIPPLAHADIRAWLLFRSAFQQSTLMGRADILKTFDYRAEFPVCEDLDMFIRIARRHKVENLPQVLVSRRIHANQSVRLFGESILDAEVVLLGAQIEELGLAPSADDLRRHVLFSSSRLRALAPADYVEWARDWLHRLIAGDGRRLGLDRASLKFAAAFFWAHACLAAAPSPGRRPALDRMLSSTLPLGFLSRNGLAWAGSAMRLSLAGRRARPRARDGRSHGSRSTA